MVSEPMCAKGSQTYSPAIKTSSRGPMRGSMSSMERNFSPFRVPGRNLFRGGASSYCLASKKACRLRSALSAERYISPPMAASALAVGEQVQVLFRAAEVARETQKLEKESSPLVIAGTVAQFITQNLNGFLQLYRLEEVPGRS
jgi:hypothetical protein